MQVLFSVAVACCVVLLIAIAGLWWKLRALRGRPAVMEKKPPMRERRQHPRLDLAAGSVPQAQSVRARQRGQGLQYQQSATQPRTPLQRRPDRAYHNPSFGDLRDPDIGQAPAGGVLRPTGSLGKRER